MDLVFILIIIGLAFIAITWLCDYFLKRKWIKYIFAVIPLVFGITFMFNAYVIKSEGFTDLGEFAMGIFCFIAALASLVTAIILDVVRRRRKSL